MITYQTFCQLRQGWDEEHLTMAQIARALSLHPQTVKKWIGRPRFEQRRAALAESRRSVQTRDPEEKCTRLHQAVPLR